MASGGSCVFPISSTASGIARLVCTAFWQRRRRCSCGVFILSLAFTSDLVMFHTIVLLLLLQSLLNLFLLCLSYPLDILSADRSVLSGSRASWDAQHRG